MDLSSSFSCVAMFVAVAAIFSFLKVCMCGSWTHGHPKERVGESRYFG